MPLYGGLNKETILNFLRTLTHSCVLIGCYGPDTAVLVHGSSYRTFTYFGYQPEDGNDRNTIVRLLIYNFSSDTDKIRKNTIQGRRSKESKRKSDGKLSYF